MENPDDIPINPEWLEFDPPNKQIKLVQYIIVPSRMHPHVNFNARLEAAVGKFLVDNQQATCSINQASGEIPMHVKVEIWGSPGYAHDKMSIAIRRFTEAIEKAINWRYNNSGK